MRIIQTSNYIPVIKCYQCKFYDAEYGVCKFFTNLFEPILPYYVGTDDYCSWAEIGV